MTQRASRAQSTDGSLAASLRGTPDSLTHSCLEPPATHRRRQAQLRLLLARRPRKRARRHQRPRPQTASSVLVVGRRMTEKSAACASCHHESSEGDSKCCGSASRCRSACGIPETSWLRRTCHVESVAPIRLTRRREALGRSRCNAQPHLRVVPHARWAQAMGDSFRAVQSHSSAATGGAAQIASLVPPRSSKCDVLVATPRTRDEDVLADRRPLGASRVLADIQPCLADPARF